MSCRRFIPLVAFAFALFLLVTTSLEAKAADIHWTNAAGGNWNTSGNWNSGAGPVPGASDNAIIDQAGTYTVTLDVNPTVTSIALGAASGTQTLSSTGRTITISAASTILANGVLVLTGSTLAGTGSLSNQGILVGHGAANVNVGLTTSSGSVVRCDGNSG